MTVSFWHTDELHVAKLLAVKRTVVTVSKWPTADSHVINFWPLPVVQVTFVKTD